MQSLGQFIACQSSDVWLEVQRRPSTIPLNVQFDGNQWEVKIKPELSIRERVGRCGSVRQTYHHPFKPSRSQTLARSSAVVGGCRGRVRAHVSQMTLPKSSITTNCQSEHQHHTMRTSTEVNRLPNAAASHESMHKVGAYIQPYYGKSGVQFQFHCLCCEAGPSQAIWRTGSAWPMNRQGVFWY